MVDQVEGMVATYTKEALADLAAGYSSINGKVKELMLASAAKQYKTDSGRIHATQGFILSQ